MFAKDKLRRLIRNYLEFQSFKGTPLLGKTVLQVACVNLQSV